MGERTMTITTAEKGYRPTESKYKGGAREMYVTYDLEQKTRGERSATYPKVKRVYVSGNVKDWKTGFVRKKTGREVHGVRIVYEQRRRSYQRKGYVGHRGEMEYPVEAANVATTGQRFAQVVEIPATARNMHFYSDDAELPANYQEALQRVR
jgi:hypothetical protein